VYPIKNKKNYTVSVPCQRKCTVSCPKGYSKKKYIYKDEIWQKNFTGGKTKSDLY